MPYGDGYVLEVKGRPYWYYEIPQPGAKPIRRSLKVAILPNRIIQKLRMKEKIGAKELEKAKAETRSLAEEKFREIVKGHRSGDNTLPPVASEIVTITKLLDRYLSDIEMEQKEGGRASTTLTTYRGQANNHLKPFFGHLKPEQISTQLGREYRAMRTKQESRQGINRKEKVACSCKPVKQITINRELGLLRASLNVYAEEAKTGFQVPTFKMTSELGNVREGFLRYDEFESKLIPELRDHHKAILTCAFCCGGRLSEWLRLDWTDINFETGYIHFTKTKFKNRARDIKIVPGEMRNRLLELRMKRDLFYPNITAVFTYEGKRLTGLNQAWTKARKRAFPDRENVILFHDMRRSANRLMNESYVSQAERMAIMGHQTPSMDFRYGITDKVALDQATDKVAANLAKQREALQLVQ